MSFLQIGILTALVPLIVGPLVVHLLNRRMPLKVLFPDIERIRRSMAGRSRLAQWRHLIMLLIRTLAFALLLLAFLQPVLPRLGSEMSASRMEKGRRVLLLVDHSLSMEHRAGTQTAASQRAVIESGKILATLKAGDKVNAIIVNRSPTTALPDFTNVPGQLQSILSALPPALERADFCQSISPSGECSGKRSSRCGGVYFV